MANENLVYDQQARQYDLLVSREDYQQNISQAIRSILAPEGLDIVELGAGTGRLTGLLFPLAKKLWAFDRSKHMLDIAAAKLPRDSRQNCQLAVADHRYLPLADKVADLVISGWSICYLVVWSGSSWRAELVRGISEMQRVLRPGGKILLFETLGTGVENPTPPDNLTEYYAFLDESGFSSVCIRTDYRFASVEEAQALMAFFFGAEMTRKITSPLVPECTGVWYLNKVG